MGGSTFLGVSLGGSSLFDSVIFVSALDYYGSEPLIYLYSITFTIFILSWLFVSLLFVPFYVLFKYFISNAPKVAISNTYQRALPTNCSAVWSMTVSFARTD